MGITFCPFIFHFANRVLLFAFDLCFATKLNRICFTFSPLSIPSFSSVLLDELRFSRNLKKGGNGLVAHGNSRFCSWFLQPSSIFWHFSLSQKNETSSAHICAFQILPEERLWGRLLHCYRGRHKSSDRCSNIRESSATSTVKTDRIAGDVAKWG